MRHLPKTFGLLVKQSSHTAAIDFVSNAHVTPHGGHISKKTGVQVARSQGGDSSAASQLPVVPWRTREENIQTHSRRSWRAPDTGEFRMPGGKR